MAKTTSKVTVAKTKGKVTGAKTGGKVTAAKEGGKTVASKAKTMTTKGKATAKKTEAATNICMRHSTQTKVYPGAKAVSGVKRKFREAVKDEELTTGSCLKRIKWSPWYKAIVSSRGDILGKQAKMFKQRYEGRSTPAAPRRKLGLRNVQIFKDNENVPAIFEVAVQRQTKRGKRFVVFSKACSSWRKTGVWDTILLNSEDVRKEVDSVLTQSCQIWARRGTASDEEALKAAQAHLSKYYDYAWLKREAVRSAKLHRRLKRGDTLIAGNI